MSRKLFNTLHPMAESGPIFLPFGEWDYDGRVRQRLDRARGEAIANELNGRIARGEPGIPVYAGHPDVPELAARYPDKGALGWIESAAVANENGRDGLVLGVKWDRDPGRGFRWFSPYWVANEREGDTWIVSAIASVGLVNNPNIPEFRLANETPNGVTSDERRVTSEVEKLANVIDRNGREHVDAGSPEGGQFAPGAGARKGYALQGGKIVEGVRERVFRGGIGGSNHEVLRDRVNRELEIRRNEYHNQMLDGGGSKADRRLIYEEMRELHAIAAGNGMLKYNPKTRFYDIDEEKVIPF